MTKLIKYNFSYYSMVKFKPYYKITWFQVKGESHNNTEFIIDKEDIKKVNKLLEEINSKIWDYCFGCGKPLTKDMKEDEDWFNINNCGESFPLCAECFNKNSK